jgi:hypothetical protein
VQRPFGLLLQPMPPRTNDCRFWKPSGQVRKHRKPRNILVPWRPLSAIMMDTIVHS